MFFSTKFGLDCAKLSQHGSIDRGKSVNNIQGRAPLKAVTTAEQIYSLRVVRESKHTVDAPLISERTVSAASRISVLMLWELAARAGWMDVRFFPAPSSILQDAWNLLLTGELIKHLGISVTRVVAGFVIGAVPALVLGMAMGLNKYVRAFFQPLIDSIYPIPKIAILPLIVLIFGLEEASKYAIIAVGVFFQVVITTAAGVAAIEKIYFDVAASFNAGRIRTVTSVLLPGSLPVVVAGLRLGIGTALLLVVAAEMVAAKSGLGYLIWQSWQMFEVETMYVGLISIALLGWVFFTTMNYLESVMLAWKPKNYS